MVSNDEILFLQRQDGEEDGRRCRIVRGGTSRNEDDLDEGDVADAQHQTLAAQAD